MAVRRACDLLILTLVTTTVAVLPAQRSRAAGELLEEFDRAARRGDPHTLQSLILRN